MYIFSLYNLKSCRHISEDLHKAGINDWFIHVYSQDEAGLKKVMKTKNPEAKLVAVDTQFYNPLVQIELV